MSHGKQTRDLDSDISALRQGIEQLMKQSQPVADFYSKNAAIQECLLFLNKALTCISDEDESWPDPSVQIDWVAFGKKMNQRRTRAKLGVKELADLADVSEPMIRAIEHATKRPSRKLLLRLLAIPALNLRLYDVIGESSQTGVVPTLWISPEYDPRQLITELVERLNGNGCSLEQTTAYLDYQSACDWLATCNTPSHLEAFSNTGALEAVAERVVEKCGDGSIDVIALGSGDAHREVKLIQAILQHTERRKIKDVRVFLIDISHMLLAEGIKHAQATLGSSVKNIFALHGNFHQLSQYPLFSPGDMRSRCRVFTLLGCTLANLDNEVRFFRDTMNAAGVGDFFVTDYTNAYAKPEEPERIRELDPPIRGGVLPTHQEWLGGAIKRFSRGARSVDLSIELNTDCIVRGSYELMFVAHVLMEKSAQPRRFVVFRVRRYDPTLLEECLARTGWTAEQRIPYGGNERQKLTLSLLRKSW
jgi:transcriptional regulator with XRE-family HTH domain